MKLRYFYIVLVLFFCSGYIFPQSDSGKIIILYDNYQFTDNTISDWGFSCLIIHEKDTILFDTGARKDIFFHNLHSMGIEISTIQTLVISHHHGDHTGNIFSVIEENSDLDVFVPSSLNGKFLDMMKNYGVRPKVDQSMRQIAHNIFLSGEMGFQIREQGIVIKTEKGLILITGCSHPGIDRMVRKVSNKFKEKVYLVVGGFHMDEYSDDEISEMIHTFQESGVEKIAPGHCTGQRAMDMFRKAYQYNFIRSGTGKVIEF